MKVKTEKEKNFIDSNLQLNTRGVKKTAPAGAEIKSKNRGKLIKCSAGRTFSILFALLIAVSFICAAFASGVAYAQEKSDKTAEVALPDISETKTSEVCVLGLGAGSDSVALGSETSPAFASNGPSSFAIDKDENIYILDALNFRVIKVSKDGKIGALLNYPKGETDKKEDWYYMSDIAVSPENGNIYLLNQTLKNIFILSPSGDMRASIDIKAQCEMPHKIFVSNFGEIYVSDQAGGKVVVYNGEGTVTGRLSDDTAGVYADKKGFIFALGEFDKEGRDVLLMDAVSNRQPRIFAKLVKSIKDTEPYDYQILGLDASYNFYASIVEKIAEDVIQTLVYKFDENGKTVSRVRIMPLIHIGDTMPTRYFNISPNGVIYGVTANKDYTKYVIVKIE